MAKRPGEFELIDRIRSFLPGSTPGVVIGPGDDCAAVEARPGRLHLLTCDAMVEGRHFERRHSEPRDLGARLAAINLSDIAAMGGDPRWALLSMALPDGLEEAWSVEVARGVSDELTRFGSTLIGGNLSGISGPAVLDLTLVGEVESDRVLTRAGARPGDVAAVTGWLGASAAGRLVLSGAVDGVEAPGAVLAHRGPIPRIEAGRASSSTPGVHGAIDISDGLVSDLAHVCLASGLSAEIDLGSLPIPDEVRAVAAAAGIDPVRLAASGGEDYELLLAIAPDRFGEVRRAIERVSGVAVTAIGRFVAAGEFGARARFLHADGREWNPETAGWDHFQESQP